MLLLLLLHNIYCTSLRHTDVFFFHPIRKYPAAPFSRSVARTIIILTVRGALYAYSVIVGRVDALRRFTTNRGENTRARTHIFFFFFSYASFTRFRRARVYPSTAVAEGGGN